MTMKIILQLIIIVTVVFVTACSEPKKNDDGVTKPIILGALNDVDNYLLGLKPWQELSPTKTKDDGTPVGQPTKSEQGKYQCSNQEYSLSKTPDKVVIFDDNSAALWPGSVIQGKPFLDGKFEQLPIADIAPLALTIDKSIPQPSVMVEKPSKQSMQTAIAELVMRAKDIKLPVAASYLSKEIYSVEQLLLDFNLSAKYITQSAKASLQLDSKVETKTFSYYLVQNMFTVSVPAPRKPSMYFNNISMEDIDDQKAIGRIAQDNPPLYVESVTYGRILLFTLTSTSSQTEINAALEYANKGGADINADLKAKYKALLASAEIKIVPYGGPWQEAAELIKTANIQSYFSSTEPPLTTAVPISYKLNVLANANTATVAETTSYTKKSCHVKKAPAIKNNAKFTLQYAGGGDNRYLSVANWRAVGLTGKWPYPTLQLKAVKLKFKGNGEPLKHGMNIRFKTTETKSQNKDIGKYNELGAWAAKPKVFYDQPKANKKQNWIFTKSCKDKSKNNCDNLIRYHDKVHIRSEYKPKKYLCNDSSGKSIFIVTTKAKCTWKILP